MPTIIDSLIVKLGLDTKDFNSEKRKVDQELKDTGENAEKSGNKVEKLGNKAKKSGKESADSFSEVTKTALKYFAAIGGTVAIKRFVEQTIEANAALNRLSVNLNVAVSTISAWSNAAELSGGSAEGLQGTMDMLSRAQTQLKLTGESSLLPYFTALGISLSDAAGKARPIEDILLNVSDKLSKLDRPTANNFGRMIGIDQGTLNLLLKGRSEVELLIKRQREFNAVTKQQAEESARLQRAIIEGKQSFAAFGRELVSQATPALEKIFSLLTDFGNWARENKEFVQDFLKIMAVGLAEIAAATIPINLTALAVVGLAAAIAALWQDYQTWKRGGDSFIDWAKWEPGFKAAGSAIKWINDLLGDLIYRGIAAADTIASLLKGDWKRAERAELEFVHGRPTPSSDKKPQIGNDISQPTAQSESNEISKSPPAQRRSNEQNDIGVLESSDQKNEVVKSTTSKDSKYLNSSSTSENSGSEKVIENGRAISNDRQPGLVNDYDQIKAVNDKRQKEALDYFQQQGWTRQQAAGIVANLRRESSLNPDAIGDKGRAFGLAQWHPDRQQEFKDNFGKNIRDASFEDQLAFIQYELTHGKEKEAGNLLRNAGSAQEAAASISINYERPADVAGEAFKRGQLAQQLLGNAPLTQETNPVIPSPYQDSLQNAQQLLGGVPSAASLAQVSAPVAPAPSQNSMQNNIGEVKVYTAATDADGIAKDMGKSLNYLFASQANYGLF